MEDQNSSKSDEQIKFDLIKNFCKEFREFFEFVGEQGKVVLKQKDA